MRQKKKKPTAADPIKLFICICKTYERGLLGNVPQNENKS